MRKREALFLTWHRLKAQCGRIQKGGAALEKGHPAAFTEIAQAAREFLDDPLLPGAQLADVNSGFGKGHTPVRRLAGVFENFGDMQQRLGGNTTIVEADPTGVRLLVDEGHLHTQIGG